MKKTFISALLFFSAAFLFGGSTFSDFTSNDVKPDSTGVSIFSSTNDQWVESILSKMTLEEKAAQMVFAYTRGVYMSEDSPQYQRLVHLVKDLKVGGMIIFQSEIYDQAILINKLQKLAKVPLLFTSDFEHGVAQHVGDATDFPTNMALGAADDSLGIYKMGRIIAKEGKALGVYQDYAPVSDVNNNPDNPIINVRSFGEDVMLVQKLSGAFIKGIQDGGMIATAKHFPGHGNTSLDSHRELPTITGSKEELAEVELAPFKSDIKDGVMSIMIAHLAVPAYEPDTKLPSTLSKNIITGLLQNELGFKGLVVTDAMGMHAITNSFSTGEATVMAVKAGNDAILFPDDPIESIQAIVKAVQQGDLTEARLDRSVRKILLAKKWAGLDKNKFIDISKISNIVGIDSHWKVAKNLARKSITIVKDEKNLIPLSSDPRVKYANISLLDSPYPGTENYFNSLVGKRTEKPDNKTLTTQSTEEEFDDALKSAENADVVLLSVFVKVRSYSGKLGLTDDQEDFINKVLGMDKPVVITSHGNPYILRNFKKAGTYICNYGSTKVSELALAEAMFGEINVSGKLPVTIPGTKYAFGKGLKESKTALLNVSNVYSEEEEKQFAGVDRVVNQAIQDTAFPGAVLLVAKDGKILHEKAFGHFTYDYASAPVTTDAIFDLASVTKVTATTTAAMICYDRGLYKLDDKVAKYIPEFGSHGKENVTIKDLLVHDSGLRPDIHSYRAYENMKDPEVGVLHEIYNDTLIYPTGTKMVYSDLGMITMGKIIEKITGETLDKFVREQIFEPMGMVTTMYNPPAKWINRIAPTENDTYWRHRQIRGTVHDETSDLMHGVAGHAGLFSDAGDLAKLLQMLLQKGEYQGKRYIKASTVELFTKRQSDLSSRALGWDTKSGEGYSSAGHYFSTKSYGHTGFTGTSLWTDPTRNLFVVLLTNRVYPTRNNHKIGRVRPEVHDAVIKALEK